MLIHGLRVPLIRFGEGKLIYVDMDSDIGEVFFLHGGCEENGLIQSASDDVYPHESPLSLVAGVNNYA